MVYLGRGVVDHIKVFQYELLAIIGPLVGITCLKKGEKHEYK